MSSKKKDKKNASRNVKDKRDASRSVEDKKDASRSVEEEPIRTFFRGHVVYMYPPTALGALTEDDFTKEEVALTRRLRLGWVYGGSPRDCKPKLFVLPTGEIVYFVAKVVVLHNLEEHKQRHYLEHTHEIKCLAIHPNKILIATGQRGSEMRDAKAHIRIWNSVSLHTQTVIGMYDFELSVSCLNFSKADGGGLLLVVDDALHCSNISVWNWQEGEHGHRITQKMVFSNHIMRAVVSDAEFHPLDGNVIVTYASTNFHFWSLDDDGTLHKYLPEFRGRAQPQCVTSMAFLQSGDLVTGDSNGDLIIWARGTNTMKRSIKKVHEGNISSICILKDGSVITGDYFRIVQLDFNLKNIVKESKIEIRYGSLRAIAEGKRSQLLIGTKDYILSGTLALGFQPIYSIGHIRQICGLAAHPSFPHFATVGYDDKIFIWDSLSHTILWKKNLLTPIQSVAFSPDGNVIVVGGIKGQWTVFDLQTRELLDYHRDGLKPLTVIQYSPNGAMVAIGSEDFHIYIYLASEDSRCYSRLGICVGHLNGVTHIDWSLDNLALRSNSSNLELLYWNGSTCARITQTILMRDVEWATSTCTVTFNTIGIWSEGAWCPDVTSCDRSHNGTLIAVGDTFGNVKLYSYPVIQRNNRDSHEHGRQNYVSLVRFLKNDSKVISIGGLDTCFFQWNVS